MNIRAAAACIALVVVSSGCGHNVYFRGLGAATPYGALGYGDFACVKDNVTIKSKENVNKDGVVETSHSFKIGDQTTGYDVDKEKAKNKEGK